MIYKVLARCRELNGLLRSAYCRKAVKKGLIYCYNLDLMNTSMPTKTIFMSTRD